MNFGIWVVFFAVVGASAPGATRRAVLEIASSRVRRTSYPAKINQSAHSTRPYVRSRKCMPATGLRTQHPSTMRTCAVVGMCQRGGKWSTAVVTVAFPCDEILECLLWHYFLALGVQQVRKSHFVSARNLWEGDLRLITGINICRTE